VTAGPPERYRRAAEATESAVGERVVLYHRRSRTALVLNPTASWIWRQLAEPRTAPELAGDLRERFRHLGVEQAERDVATFLADLSRHQMIAVGP
jgi:Coenzyme PQQ synthesis protein D (PqqD)